MTRRTRPGGQLGLILPTLPQGRDPSWDVGRIAGEAEAAGADSLWACDHLAWHSPVMEVFTALTLAAAATKRCRVGTSVLQLPLRPAPLVAKVASSLQLASGGRLVLGIGVGLHEGEFDALEAEFGSRGKRCDEALVALRTLWREGAIPSGDPDRPTRYRQEPVPGDIPVWIGGSGVLARRRAARLGDGWMPLFVPPAEVRDHVGRLREELASTGREPDDVEVSIVVFVACGTGRGPAHRDQAVQERGLGWMSTLYGLPATKFARHLVSGSPARCAETISDYREVGVEHVILFVTDDEPVEQFAAIADALEKVDAGTSVTEVRS